MYLPKKIRKITKKWLKTKLKLKTWIATEGCYYFFNFYLAISRPTLSHYWRDSLTHPILITEFYLFWSSHCEPRDEVVSLSPAERLPLLVATPYPLGQSPQKGNIFQYWQKCNISDDGTITQYMYWIAYIYIVIPQQK